MRRRDFLFLLPAGALIGASRSWALRSPLLPSPAVVNPVFRSPLRPFLSLNGDWNFSVDPNNEGLKDRWFSPDHWKEQNSGVRKIKVPGAWEAQGVGRPGLSHAMAREFARIPLRHEYVGLSWYQKTINVPAGWEGKRAWLKIGGEDSKGLFWFNGKYLGYLYSYTSAGYKFEVTPYLKQGENTVVALVNNKVNSHKGLVVSRDQFGGLYRDIELEATSPSYLEDVWVQPDFDNRRALVRVRLAAPWDKQASGNYRLRVQVYDLPGGKVAGEGGISVQKFSYTGTDRTIPINLNPFKPWSPEHPHLYKAEIRLEQGGKEIDSWIERFGVRKIERHGPDFYLNGKKCFFRGFGDDYIYPITVSSPPSREYHKRHLALAHSYGFNYIRLHSHVENPEYFQAADEVGIMIQAALPYEGILPSPPGPYQPMDDLNELIYQYRRYISLTTYCMGNEGLAKEKFRGVLYRTAKMLDPTRLVLHQDGGVNYEGISDFRSGPVNVPVTEKEVEGNMPVVLHEYLNLSGPPNPRLEPLFTGGEAPPYHLAEAKDHAQKLGLEWALVERAIDGGHELQSIYQKLGLEDARSVQGVKGYDYWTIVDYLALMPQGLLNLFWEPKRSTPEYFRQFNSQVVLLLPDLSPYGVDRVFISGDTVSHELACANYGENAISDSSISWSLEGNQKTYSQGHLENVNVSQGALAKIGSIEFPMPVVDHPMELSLRVKMAEGTTANEWKFYCFPRHWNHAKLHAAFATSAIYHQLRETYHGLKLVNESFARRHLRRDDLLITTKIDENTFHMLESGGKVLLLNLAGFSPEKVGARMGWWSPSSNQRGTALADSEAFAGFPVHEGMPNPSLFRLFQEAVKMDERLGNHVDALALTLGSGPYIIPPEKEPPWAGMVDVGASRAADYLVNVFQVRVGTGRLFASGFDMLSGKPEANYLLDSFLKYVESAHFAPSKEISAADLKRITSAA